MAKIKTQYICQNCGAISPKWIGQCADCGAWNTLIETVAAPASKSRGGGISGAASGRIQRIDEVQLQEEPREQNGIDGQRCVLGKSVAVRVDLVGVRVVKTKNRA